MKRLDFSDSDAYKPHQQRMGVSPGMIRVGRSLNVADLQQSVVAIIHLRTQPVGIIHQVVLRTDKVHDGLIRIGETPGDEANGWQYPENIEVISVLGRAIESNGKWDCVPFEDDAGGQIHVA